MQLSYQKTIRSVVSCQGVGLHSGQMITAVLKPAPTHFGIVFRRVDLSPPVDIPASHQYIGSTDLSTTLERKASTVSTIEHLLSALIGLGVDNCLVEVNGPEIPIMDGSASPFVFLLKMSGLVTQSAKKNQIVIKEKIEVHAPGKYCCMLPHDGFKVAFAIDFKDKTIQNSRQYASFELGKDCYEEGVARARTFGFMNQVEQLRSRKKILGASLKNAVVLGDSGVVNEDGLKYHDEFVKHKILDSIGDLSLLGHSIQGAFVGRCSGHYMNKLLIDAVIKSGAYSLEGAGQDAFAQQ